MNNKGLSNGLLAGILGIIVLLISYFIDQGFYLKYAGYVLWVVYLYFMYTAAKQAREEQGGFISFSKVLGPVFLTFVVGSFLVSIFQYIMYNIIDPSLLDAMYDQAVAQIERMSGMLGEEGTEAALDQLEEKGVNYGFGTAALGWAGGLIIPGIILALIISAIMKKTDNSGV